MKKLFCVILAVVMLLSLSPAPHARAETAGPQITAPAAVLMEAGSGKVLWEKNAHEQRPCASITKVMTLCLVFEAIEAGELSLEEELSASAHAASMGGSDIWLKEGERMSTQDLIKATVIMSANDAAVVLAERVAGSEPAFVARMNEKAAALEMGDTVFKNCNGLDEEGHLTSAWDVALMSRELVTRHPQIFDYTLTWMDSVRGGETQLVNTNKLIRSYPGITGLKTGTTSKAGSCVTATAQRDGLSLIGVILGDDTTEHRFADAASLLDFGFGGWSLQVPESPVPDPLPVEGGMEETVSLRLPKEMPALLTKSGDKSRVEEQLQLLDSVQAPIEAGAVLGKIVYRLPEGEILGEAEITAGESVEEMRFLRVLAWLARAFVRL